YEICDRVTVMYAGQEVETAPVAAFFGSPRHPYTLRLLESLPRHGRELRGIGGEVPSPARPPGGCRFHPRSHPPGHACRTLRPPTAEHGTGHRVRCHHPLAGETSA